MLKSKIITDHMLDTELKQHSFRMVGYAKGRIYGA
ncbi:hypothetical protein T4C_11274 [Trichinella pseudospiralis]|uniref:Uncharacterized protein n=1 Tax=Trichinella pseudospiralis TaxID=6337 RepID=A0A0V1H2I4_TRIPS|nr:hypothetical protein T4C_11274 [Trichinella pseudospiralis]